MKDAQEMLDHLAKFAKVSFAERGHVVPMWTIEGPNDILPIIAPLSGAEGEREAIMRFIKEKAKEINAHVVGFIAEAWALHGATEADIGTVRVSEHPKRIEVIHVMAEDRMGIKSGHYVIHRPEGGEAYLSEFKSDGKADEYGGSFVGALEKFNA
jgi:hypothetical protein